MCADDLPSSEQEHRPEDMSYESEYTSSQGAEEMEGTSFFQTYNDSQQREPSGSTTPLADVAATAAAAMAVAGDDTSPSTNEEDDETNPSTATPDTDGMDLEMEQERSPDSRPPPLQTGPSASPEERPTSKQEDRSA